MRRLTIRKAAQAAVSLSKCTGAVETTFLLPNNWRVKVRRIGDLTNYYIADSNGYSYGGLTNRRKFEDWAKWFMGKGGA